jgi:anti-sigma regulatory factor (Ser/Thr protein kinase)
LMSGPDRNLLTLEWGPSAATRASDWVRELCREKGVSEDDTYRLDLCVQEVVQNILDHSDRGDSSSGIELEAGFDGREAILRISDSGTPFDPRQAPTPVEADRLDKMQVGGWGIHLVREFTDRLDYQRVGEKNVVTLGFDLKD